MSRTIDEFIKQNQPKADLSGKLKVNYWDRIYKKDAGTHVFKNLREYESNKDWHQRLSKGKFKITCWDMDGFLHEEVDT